MNKFIAAFSLLASTCLYAGEGPYLGWNSFDSYGSRINHEQAMSNLKVFIDKMKPAGYEYFVLDAGWYTVTGQDDRVDEYGRLLPSEELFPEGFKPLADYAHQHGVKFGIHMMRGIPRHVVKRNLPVMGTDVRAADIANVNDTCSWNRKMYGVDMSRPGAQAYYDSVLELIASWGVDFIKYDDIVHKPREIDAVNSAREKTGRKIVLSISPGDDINPQAVEAYKKADMVRITRDIWDLQKDIDISFERWEEILPIAGQGFWLDLDMIPFGHIRLNVPLDSDRVGQTRGYERLDNFSYAQKKTFITQRALAASPLFMGGALVSSPEIVFELITDKDMLACNQNGVTGRLMHRISDYGAKFDVWAAPHKTNKGEGWIGVFNRAEYMNKVKLDKAELGLDPDTEYALYDIWGKSPIEDADEFIFGIEARDVLFIHYKKR